MNHRGCTLTASKLISESTAIVAALLSAWFASRRKRVLRKCRNWWEEIKSKKLNAPPWGCTDRKPSIRSEGNGGNGRKVPTKLIRLPLTLSLKNLCPDLGRVLARIPQTSEISNAVGTIRNKIACIRKEIPFVPLSIARVRPPVWRVKWNFRSRWRRCSKVSRATFRIARWPMLAKTEFSSSPESVAPIRAKPSDHDNRYWGHKCIK